jgi:L,D-transpeptidase ErfK/SrfK
MVIMVKLKRIFLVICGLLLGYSLCVSVVSAGRFPLPLDGNALIGQMQSTSANVGDTPASVAQRYNIGLNAIIAANPGTTERALNGGYLKITTEFLLPPLPRKGIVINLPEMRMYYYLKDSDSVMTFPVGIGKVGKTIPIQNTAITRKVVNPVWIPPADIRQFNRDQGIELPYMMPAGPDNPLGPYAIYLRIPTYLIHSTIFPESIGRRASFGCIRMNESDIKEFFPLVSAGTAVAIINMPNKVGWSGDQLYLEAHPALEEHNTAYQSSLDGVVNSIQNTLSSKGVTLVNWQLAAYILEQPDGIPHEIGMRVN